MIRSVQFLATFAQDAIDLDVKLISSSNNSSCTTKVEFLFARVSGNSIRKLWLGVVYRSPGNSLDDCESITYNIIDKYSDKIVLGDWDTNLCGTSTDANNLMQIFHNLGLCVVNRVPIHYTGDASTLLDLCLVDDICKTSDLPQFPIPFLSRHHVIGVFYSVAVVKKPPRTITMRHYIMIDSTVIWSATCFPAITGTNYFTTPPLIIKLIPWKIFYFNLSINLLHPKWLSCRSRAPCIISEIRNLMRNRNNLLRRFARVRDLHIFMKYQVIRNKVKTLIQEAKRQYFRLRLSKVCNFYTSGRNLGIWISSDHRVPSSVLSSLPTSWVTISVQYFSSEISLLVSRFQLLYFTILHSISHLSYLWTCIFVFLNLLAVHLMTFLDVFYLLAHPFFFIFSLTFLTPLSTIYHIPSVGNPRSSPLFQQAYLSWLKMYVGLLMIA